MAQYKRKEYKYYAPLEMLEQLRERFLSRMEHDPFCRDREANIYSVRSIYLDTPRLLFFYEKLDSVKIRKKLRVRVYNYLEPDCSAFLEIKRKYNNNIFKERAKVPLEEAPNLMNGAGLNLAYAKAKFNERAVMDKFIYLTKRLKLETKVLITYEREALVGIDDPDLRVTFDMNVRSFPLPDFYEIYREDDLRSFAGTNFILEIKFYGRMPVWTRNVIRDFGLRVQAISKYCNGLKVWLPSVNIQGQPQ